MPHRVVRPRAPRRIAPLAVLVLVPGLALTVCGRTLSVARPAAAPAGLAAARPAWLPLALVGAERTALPRPTSVPTQLSATPSPTSTPTATVVPSVTAVPATAYPTLDCPRPTDPLPSPTPEATPTGDPLGGDPPPPPAVLEVAGQSHHSGVGTYCWPVTRMCVDYWAVVTPREPIRVAGDLTGRLRLVPALAPSTLIMSVFPVTPDEDRAEPGSPRRIWEPKQPGLTYALLLERDQSVRLARPPGLYVIEIFAAWKDLRADVDYGFLVEVTAQGAGRGQHLFGRPLTGASREASAIQLQFPKAHSGESRGVAPTDPVAANLGWQRSIAGWAPAFAGVDLGEISPGSTSRRIAATPPGAATAAAGADVRPGAGSPRLPANQPGLRRLLQPAKAGLAPNEPGASAPGRRPRDTQVADTIGQQAAPAQSAAPPDQLQFSLTVSAPADRFAELGGIAVAPNGGMYVLDIGNHRVLQLGPDGAFRRTWGAPGQREGLFDLLSTDLRDAEVALGLAVAPDGSVYVADKGNHRIQHFRADGGFVASFGQYGDDPGELHSPVGLAVAQDGTVYVADTGNRRVQRFTADGRPLAAWPLSGPCPGALSGSSPWGLAVAPDGTVYVADAAYSRACVQAYDADGRPKRGWRVPASEEGIRNAGGRGPVALSVAPDGSLYVVAWRAEYGLYHFSPEGQMLNAWGTPISMNGYYQGVGGVAAAPDGSVYLAAGPAIVHYAESGRVLDQIDARYSEYGQVYGHTGVATDLAGNVYLANTANDRVQQLAPDGRFLRQWGDTPGGPDILAEPADVAVAADGTVIVADTGHDRLAWFAPDGGRWGSWGGLGDQPGQFRGPEGVAVAPDGSVYVADTGNHRVQMLTATGAFVRQWPTDGAGGTGGGPVDVAVAFDATVRVVRAGDWRTRVFSLTGEPLYNLGEFGATDGQLRDPAAVAVAADGATLVTDRANDRVVRFDPCGRVLASLGEPGDDLGQLDGPTGVAVAPDGSVYVADSGNGRLQRFTLGGEAASIVAGVRDLGPSGGTYPGRYAPEGDLGNAGDMASAPDGSLFVLDDYPSLRIQRLGPRGEFLGQWSLAARPPAERLRSANALAVAPDGSILVVENFNQIHRVHRYRPTGEYLGYWDFTGQEDPRAIAVGPDGSVYLGDLRGPTGVQRFSADGRLLGAWTGWSQYYGPMALAVDAAGAVFTAQGATIRRYTPEGVREREWGGAGAERGQFGDRVGDLAVLPDGTIVAADWGNQRVQRFDRDGRWLDAWWGDNRYDPNVPPWPFPGEIAAAPDGTMYALNSGRPRRLQAFRPDPPADWHAAWYPNRWLTQRPVAVTGVEDVDLDWGAGSPNPLLPPDHWSLRLERPFALAEGDHVLAVTAAGGARVWLDDRLLLDDWDGPAVDASLPFASTGALQRVIVEYNDPGGSARLRVLVR